MVTQREQAGLPAFDDLAGALPAIDAAELLLCDDGCWRLALLSQDEIVMAPLQAAAGDQVQLERILRDAADLIGAQHRTGGDPDGT